MLDVKYNICFGVHALWTLACTTPSTDITIKGLWAYLGYNAGPRKCDELRDSGRDIREFCAGSWKGGKNLITFF